METDQGSYLKLYFTKNTKAASLAAFRVLFGAIMCISIIRFWSKGWIEEVYLIPQFHFKYAGFEWVALNGTWVYLLFVLCGVSALFVSLGFKYRLSIIVFFLSFTYIELLEKTTYLNHYYFISVISFILIFLPAHVSYSIDAYRNNTIRFEYIPKWTVDILKLLLTIVYLYAGLAKLNSDWLFRAMPLALWLPTKSDIPIIGSIMHKEWLHYFFSWTGALYDLTIAFLLLYSRTRILAFVAVVVFHILTAMLFPIGMFPYIMIVCTLIFFNPCIHEKAFSFLGTIFKWNNTIFQNGKQLSSDTFTKITKGILLIFILVQLLLPFRYLLHNNNVYWTEQGYRFSWRVMLMEKTGNANFKIVNGKSGKRFYVQNSDFLTPLQQKEMSTQPDFILEYGQFLGNHFAAQGHENVEVYVESYAALNGRPSQIFIDPNVNLMSLNYYDLCESHIHELND